MQPISNPLSACARLADADIVVCPTCEHYAACQRMLPCAVATDVHARRIRGPDRCGDRGGIDAVMAEGGRIDTNAESLDIVVPLRQTKEYFERVYQ